MSLLGISRGVGEAVSFRKTKGQAFILILIVLLALIVVFVVLPMNEARRQSSPAVLQVFWQVNGQNVTTAFAGEEVELHVVIEAAEEYVGSLVVKVRKDVSYWFDSDHSVKTFPASLVGNQVAEFVLAFAVDEATGSRLRGYFVEVDFSVKRTNWVMENSYPPRLKVFGVEQDENMPA